MRHNHPFGARSVTWLFSIAVGLAFFATPTKQLHAQDSCAAVDMTVSPCLSGEKHVNSSSTAVFTGFNYGYVDDTFYAPAQCTGIVTTCSTTGGNYHFVGAGDPVTIAMPFHVSGPSGTGTVGGRIASEYIGGYVDVATTVYGQALVTIDSSQAPVYGSYQNVSMCAAGCFTAGASISTVPFYTLGQARGVTLVYNEDRAHPKPFVYATVSPAADGPAISSYQMSATLNGAAVHFTNGETTLNFRSPGNVPVRLGGQVSLGGAGPSVYTLVVNTAVHYSGGSTTNLSYTSILAANDASNSVIARGWTIAGIDRLSCSWSQGCLTYGGDGSIVLFTGAFPSFRGADSSSLAYNSSTSRYTRTYVDGHTAYYDPNGYMVAVADIYGRTTTITYDGSGRPTQIIDPRRNSGASVPYIQLAYGTYGLSSITETGGPGPDRVTTITVGSDQNLTASEDPDGYTTHFSYDVTTNQLKTVTDRGDSTTTMAYDAYGKLSSVQSPSIQVDAGGGGTTSATPVTYYTAWQGIGVPTTATSPTAPYAKATTDIIGVIQAPGSIITQFGVTSWGQATTVINPLDQWSFTRYGGMYRARMIHPNGAQDTTAYDAYGRLVMSKPAGDSATYYHYNSVSQVDSVWGMNVVKVTNSYNADHTLLSSASASGPSVSYTYNAMKEALTATDNASHQVTYGYDGIFANPDEVILPGSRTTIAVIDSHGRDSVVTAPTLAAVTTVYDAMNRPTHITQAGRAATVVTYDPLFRTEVEDPNGNTTYTAYNALGWPTSRTDPNSVTEYFRYDIAGRKTSWTNRRGAIMSYTYDDKSRLLSRVGTGINDSYSYSDDPYLGNIMVASNSVETDSIFHKPVVQTAGGADSTVTYLNGARYRVVRPYVGSLAAASTMSITSSTSGVTFNTRSVTLNSTTGLPTYVSDGFYTAYPAYNTEALESQTYNPSIGVTRNSDYISIHALDSTSFSPSALNTAFGRKYYYDAAGRIGVDLNQGAGTERTFEYDSYGELATVTDKSGCYATGKNSNSGISSYCSTTTGTTSYTYDAAGNRTDLGATYYAGNRLALFNGGWYTYDADGNVSQKYGVNPTPHNQQFYWNPENRLDSLKYDGYYNVTYKYNALGQPVLKYRQGTLDRALLWDGDALLAEFNSSNQRIAEYLYNGIDQPYATVTGATTASAIQYHEQDELGNVLGTHTGTSVTESISYDPWGMPTYSGTIDSRLMWKGLMWEGGPAQGDVVGLSYVRGRWYDPQAGRFIQEDPIGVDGGVNVYLYAGDDPVNGSDPSGMGPGDSDSICKFFGFGSETFSNGTTVCMVPQQLPTIRVTATPDDPPFDDFWFGPHSSAASTSPLEGLHPNLFHEEGLQDPGWADPLLLLGGLEDKGSEIAIDVGEEAFQHVLETHTIDGAMNSGKSIFQTGEDLAALIRRAESVSPVRQSFGRNYERIVDAGRAIGIDRATNQPTSIYTVITSALNELRTMFPGLP